ncbi:MAG: FAD binding domain-containing protein [Streptosporangiaceae bacterium]
MKAAPFSYVRPATLDGVVAELAAADGEGKVLAGGQSLAPLLAMRLARPRTLIDINAAAGLDTLEVRDGVLRIGATVRQRDVEYSQLAAAVPALGLALPFVGHRELRSRGTICGSLAHADPAAELPAISCCVDAKLDITGPGGRRWLPADGFFLGTMTTALACDEVLAAVEFPVAQPGEGFGFAEVARRHGDFAIAGVVTRVRVLDGVVVQAVLAAFGVSARPVIRDVTAQLGEVLVTHHRDPSGEALREQLASLGDMVDTAGDTHGSPAYRRRLLTALAAREFARAYQNAAARPAVQS